MFLSNFWFCGVIFSREPKPLFIPIGLCFMKRHIWRVNYFLSEHKPVSWKGTYGELVIFFILRSSKIETSSTFLNSHQKILQKILENSRKFRFSYFHLKNSRTWIFTLWNHILQTQTSLLQPILVYTYIYNRLFSTSCCPRVWPHAFYFSIIGKSYFRWGYFLSLSIYIYLPNLKTLLSNELNILAKDSNN